MGRLLLCCLVVFALLGCKGSSPSASAPVSKVTPPAKSVETGEGPGEKDLPEALDMPLYPGAKLISSKIASAGTEKRYHVTLETKDTPKQVADFFQSIKIPSAVQGDEAQAMGETKNHKLVIVDAKKKGDHTEIVIKVSPGMSHG